MPDSEQLPEGPRREFVKAIRRLYIEAGEPARIKIASRGPFDGHHQDQRISPEMVSRILKGETLPNRKKLSLLIRNLLAVAGDSGAGLADVVQEINDTWRTAKQTEQGVLPTPPSGIERESTSVSDEPAVDRERPDLMTNPTDPVNVERFKSMRRRVSTEVARLITRAVEEQARFQADPEVPLLTKPGWIPAEPLPLSSVHLSHRTGISSDFSSAKSRLAAYWPPCTDREPLTYSAAVGRYDAPTNWFDGLSFRLVGVRPGRGSVRLEFSKGSYFEAFDTTEPLGFEAAMRHQSSQGATITGPYREWIGDPFDLATRCGVPGINTLTIRRSRRDITFYMHQRTSVATAVGTVHVVPAGEFQPSSKDEKRMYAELDLRSTIVREYAEEFLGSSDVLSSEENEAQIDFETKPEYAPLDRALRQDKGRLHYLGLGMYPLTWKPEILLVCVFEDKHFDRIFAGMVDEMIEGRLQVNRRLKGFRYAMPGRRGPFQGIRFDERTVREYVDNPLTLPAGRACLALAWRHRRALGLV